MKKVSILSAVHNESDHISEMIASVCAQTLQDWELLFVDDLSSDDTVDKIRAAARRDDRIRLVSYGERIGKVSAFNAAYAVATGEFVVLLAGDDRLPAGSLQDRVNAFAASDNRPSVAFFKLRTFSNDPKFDGLILPRGKRGNTSGGTIAMSHAVAKAVFPIPEHLSGEDIWLRYAAIGAAEEVIEKTFVVLEYRIHPGNSIPRDKPFGEMFSIMTKKHQAYDALLESKEIQLAKSDRIHLASLQAAEDLRRQRKPVSLLIRATLPLGDRLALASMAHPGLWAIRRMFFGILSGRRSG